MGVVGNLQYTPSKVVIHALKDMKRPKGVSFDEVLSYAVGKYNVKQSSFKSPLKHALKRGLKYRILEFHNGRYKLSSRPLRSPNKSTKSAEKQLKKVSNRVAKKDTRIRKKKTNLDKKQSFRGTSKSRKPKSDRRSFRPRRKNLDMSKRRARSEVLRSESCDPSRQP